MPGTAAIMGRVASIGAHSLYLGRVPAELEAPVAFGQLVAAIKRDHGALVIGVRDPGTGKDRLNPPDDHAVTDDAQVIYLATQPVLPQ